MIKKSQIWIETVIYTLIGLSVIAIILAMVIPRIEKIQDRTIVEQTITAMDKLNGKILESSQTAGNVRIVNFKIAKGRLEIDSGNNAIIYILEDVRLEMSEPDVDIDKGNVVLRTEKAGSKFKISLTMAYTIDLTYQDKEETKTLSAGAVPYKIIIENTGTKINLEVV